MREVRLADVNWFAQIRNAFGAEPGQRVSDIKRFEPAAVEAVRELCGRAIQSLSSAEFAQLWPTPTFESIGGVGWTQSAIHACRSFSRATQKQAAQELREWGGELASILFVALALPRFRSHYPLAERGECVRDPQSLCPQVAAELHNAAVRAYTPPECPDSSAVSIAWPSDPSLVVLGEMDGGLWDRLRDIPVASRLLDVGPRIHSEIGFLGSWARLLSGGEVQALRGTLEQVPGTVGGNAERARSEFVRLCDAALDGPGGLLVSEARRN